MRLRPGWVPVGIDVLVGPRLHGGVELLRVEDDRLGVVKVDSFAGGDASQQPPLLATRLGCASARAALVRRRLARPQPISKVPWLYDTFQVKVFWWPGFLPVYVTCRRVKMKYLEAFLGW